MNSAKQIVAFTCNKCGELLYRPSIVKERVFQQMLKASNGMNLK